MSKLSKQSLVKLRESVNYTRQVPKGRGTRGFRRAKPGGRKTTFLAELTAVDETESPWYYSYREVEWNSENLRYQIKDGGDEGEGEEGALPLPFPTPFCMIGDVVEIQMDSEGDKTFLYPGHHSNNTRHLSLSGKACLSRISGGYVVDVDDIDAEAPSALKVFLDNRRAREQTFFALDVNPYGTLNTLVHGSEVEPDDRKCYVFNLLDTSFVGGTCVVTWNGSCWVIVLRSC